MKLLDHVRARKAEVAARWSDLTLGTYPASSAAFFVNEKDPFRNPVGGTVRRSLAMLVDALLGDADDRAVAEALDGVVRLRAVQDFTPGRAVGFVFLARPAIRDVLSEELSACPADEHDDLSARIETLAMSAVDVFTACRQRLFELRANEAKARVHSLLKRAGAVDDEPAEAPTEPAATKGGCSV
jgi:hypothetical protein